MTEENMNTENAADDANSARTSLDSALDYLRRFDGYWNNQLNQVYKAELELTDPLIIRTNHLRQAIRYYLIPAVQNAIDSPAAIQNRFVERLSFLFSEDRMAQFFRHFYAVVEDPETKDGWKFEDRDPFQEDLLVLYDLYKVKRTMNGIVAFLKELKELKLEFPSVFGRDQFVPILKNMNSALFMAFKMAVKPKYQVELYNEISLKYLHEDRVKQRQKEKILYSRSKGLDFSPFRRIFLHILFRQTIKTAINQKETVIHYNFVDFEQLIFDYFAYFMDGSKDSVEIMNTYHCFHIRGNSLANSLIEDPDPETLMFEEIDEIKTFL